MLSKVEHKRKKDSKDFSKGSVLSNIMKLAIPMTVAQLINVLYNIVDRIYIGRIGNGANDALTGLGVCLPIITIVIAFANLIGMGGAPLFSIERGKGDKDEAESILGNSFTLLLIFGIILTVVGLIVKKPLLRLLGGSDVTMPYANSYITIYLIGNIFVMLSLGLNSFINAEGFGNIGMCTVAIGAVLNLILDPIFIFVMGMGVKGAAIATIISQFVATLWTLKFLTSDKAIIKINLKKMKCKMQRVKKIISLGIAGFIMAITNSLVQMFYNASLQVYGGDVYIAIMTIINSIREVVQMPIGGLTNSAQPVLGYNYGAGKNDRVKEGIKYLSILLIVYTGFAWIVLDTFPEFFIKIFSQNKEVVNLGKGCMHIYFFGYFMMALQFTGQTIFTSLGKSKKAIFFSIFRKVIIVIPLILILPKINSLGVNGVLLSEPISNFIGGGLCYAVMIKTVYMKLDHK